MIHPDILSRLPDPARQKLLLLDGLSDEALDLADAAQSRLNDLAARRGYPGGPEANPTVARLGAVVATQERRREELFGLVNGVVAWLRGVPPLIEIEIAAAPSPPSLAEEGESLTPEEAVMKLRGKLTELTMERMATMNAPPPRDEIRRALNAQIAKLAAAAVPTLKLGRGRVEVLFGDPRGGFEIGAAWVAGLLAWIYPGALMSQIDELIDAAVPDNGAALTDDRRQAELARLDGEIDALERVEENLISEAFERGGADILRRRNASPMAVLGVRLPKPLARERPVRLRHRLAGPAEARAAE